MITKTLFSPLLKNPSAVSPKASGVAFAAKLHIRVNVSSVAAAAAAVAVVGAAAAAAAAAARLRGPGASGDCAWVELYPSATITYAASKPSVEGLGSDEGL